MTQSASPSPAQVKNCPVCDGVQLTEQLRIDDYRVLRCSQCTVEFLDPQPDGSVLSNIYSANYFLSEREGIKRSDVARLKRQTAKLYVDQILSIRGQKKGTLLEIGCGNGDFLLEAQTRGFRVSGIETSRHATETANHCLGAELVSCGEIETVPLPRAAFDVIVFSDVIEHVPDPKRFLALVHQALSPGGLVFIATPSTDSWSRRLMGRQWMEYKLEHLFYFNRRSLNYLLKHAGFDSIGFHRNGKVLSFQYVRAHFRRFRVPIWTPLVESIGRAVPNTLAKKDLQITASGVIATAHRNL